MPRKLQKKVRGVYEHPPGSNVWWAQYFIRGRRYRERAGSKSNAITLYRKRKTEALTAQKLPELNRRHVTLGELFDDAIAFSKQHHKSSRDIEHKAAAARPKLGALWADSVTHEELAAWVDSASRGNATFNRYKAFFSLCYREGQRSGKVKDNPAQLMRRRREPTGRKRFLTEQEYRALLDTMATRAAEYDGLGWPAVALRWRRRRRAFLVSVWTGMRRGEQFTLEISQVNFQRNEIQLDNTKNGDSREIPMVPEVRAAILEEIAEHKPAGSKKLVFARERKGGDPDNMDMAWFDELLAEHGIADYTWHNNRHTFCSWLAIAGTPLKTIQELAGHRSIQTTARYAHLSPSHKRTELELVAAAHSQAAETPKRAKKRA